MNRSGNWPGTPGSIPGFGEGVTPGSGGGPEPYHWLFYSSPNVIYVKRARTRLQFNALRLAPLAPGVAGEEGSEVAAQQNRRGCREQKQSRGCSLATFFYVSFLGVAAPQDPLRSRAVATPQTFCTEVRGVAAPGSPDARDPMNSLVFGPSISPKPYKFM